MGKILYEIENLKENKDCTRNNLFEISEKIKEEVGASEYIDTVFAYLPIDEIPNMLEWVARTLNV